MIAGKCHDLLFDTFVGEHPRLNSMLACACEQHFGFYIELICFVFVSEKKTGLHRERERERKGNLNGKHSVSTDSHKTILVEHVTHFANPQIHTQSGEDVLVS